MSQLRITSNETPSILSVSSGALGGRPRAHCYTVRHMKLCLGLVAVCMGTVLLTGCGEGMGHHGKWAKAPVSTTSLTSDEIQLPGTRMPVAREWEDPWADEDRESTSDPKLQTWGAAPKPEDKYGF